MKREEYKSKLQNFKGLQHNKIPKMYEDLSLVEDFYSTLSKLFLEILNKKQTYGIKWLIGFKRYVMDQSKTIPRPFNKHLTRGHIVEVELFGHFNKELTFLHPAVVLYDDKGQLLVAPISTSKYSDSSSLHIDVDKRDGLKHNCGICLDAIRIIDKNRVLYQHTKEGTHAKVRSEVLDQIDEAMMKFYLPKFHGKYYQTEKELFDLKAEHSALKSEVLELKSKLFQYENGD